VVQSTFTKNDDVMMNPTKKNDQTAEKIIAEVTIKGREVRVERHVVDDQTSYRVLVDEIDRHGACSAEDVMRALAHYAHSEALVAP
jgi:hypothetical protein